ncbi:MAG: hypothetical protein DMG11_06275, partial [Acidobacteria bacterium]
MGITRQAGTNERGLKPATTFRKSIPQCSRGLQPAFKLWLRRSAELVFELTYKEIDLSFSAPASIAVPMFEKEDEIIALAINLVELTRRKL